MTASLKRILFLVAFTFLHACAYAQDAKPWSGFGIELNQVVGKVFKHTAKFTAPVPDLSLATDLNFTMHTYGRREWQQRRHYPVLGVGITYTNYGIDSVYGECIGIYPNIQLPLLTIKNFEWTIRFGLGVGYVTRHFTRAPSWDTANDFIGSHLNNFTMFSTDLRYRVSNHLHVQLGANFSHASDGSFRQPNLGVNMYGAHAGIIYYPVTDHAPHISRELKPLKNRWLLQARMGIAFTSNRPGGGPLFPVYLPTLYVSKRYSSKNKVYLGIDYSYHQSMYSFLKNNEIYPGKEKSLSWRSSVLVGHEFLLGRVGLVLQVGYYIKDVVFKSDKYYEKLGYNIYLIQREKGLLKELTLYTMLKTHKTVAELIEFGIGAGF